MIYIISALISLLITASLIATALYLKALYYSILNDVNKFIEMIVKGNDNEATKENNSVQNRFEEQENK